MCYMDREVFAIYDLAQERLFNIYGSHVKSLFGDRHDYVHIDSVSYVLV